MVPGYGESLGAIVSPLPERLHIDSFIGDQAVEWIEGFAAQDEKKPFFTWVSFNSPHDPYDPPETLADLYRDVPIPEPVGSLEELSEKPEYQQKIIPFFKQNLLYLIDYSRMNALIIRKIREHYLATITLIDRQIEKILQALEWTGLLESTFIVFSSDHGDHLGDHGLPFKSTYYESALMVPLIVMGPGIPSGRRNRTSVNWLDLHATFLSLAGIPVPDHVQGEDLSELLKSPDQHWERDAFSELLGSVMVRTSDMKLVLCDDGTGELYDLKEAPLEVHNYFHDLAYRGVREELTEKILKHLLAHSRVRSFGGGRHPTDIQRERCFAEIKARLEAEGYPGL